MKRIFTVGFILLSFSISNGWAQTAGLSFLKIGVGGRATGMGEAFSAVADDATATYWNPAGLFNAKRTALHVSHNEWIQGIRSEFIAFIKPRGDATWGLSLNSSTVSGIELRGEQPSIEPLATFSAHDMALGISYARQYRSRLNWGITAKFIYEKIYIEQSAGFALDAGLSYKFASHPLRAALVLQNVGKMSRLLYESPGMPTLLRTGLAYAPTHNILGAQWLFAVDALTDFRGNYHLNVGAEFKPARSLALRAGYQSGYETKNLHLGFGMQTRRLNIDYGYVPFLRNLGQGHRFSLTLHW